MRVLSMVSVAMFLAAAYVVSPYYALYRIDHAIQDHDLIVLERYADWPAIREQLRTDLKGLMMSTLADKPSGSSNDFTTGLAALLGPVMVDRIVDSDINPDGLIRMVSNRGSVDGNNRLHDFITYAFFAGPMDFRVDLRNPQKADAPSATALMEFSGFGWRVSRVKLPLEELTRAVEKSRADTAENASVGPANAEATKQLKAGRLDEQPMTDSSKALHLLAPSLAFSPSSLCGCRYGRMCGGCRSSLFLW